MVHNGSDIQTKLMGLDFISSQAILIERCKEMERVGNAMKEVAERYNGKMKIKKFIERVNERLNVGVSVDLTKKDKLGRARVCVFTDTCNSRLYEDRIKYGILFTCWVHELTDEDGRIDAERVRPIIDNQLLEDAKVVKNANDDCKNYLKYQQTIIEAVCEMYAKIENVPMRFRNIVANCVGDLTFKENVLN
jgi:hypothetical protein